MSTLRELKIHETAVVVDPSGTDIPIGMFCTVLEPRKLIDGQAWYEVEVSHDYNGENLTGIFDLPEAALRPKE